MIEVISDISINVGLKALQKKLGLRGINDNAERDVKELIELVNSVARPKVVYKVSYVDQKDGDSVEIDGVKFTSRVLRVNLDEVGRVFPFVATCGIEIDSMEKPGDIMKAYYLDAIKNLLLESTLHYLEDYLTKKYALGQLSKMAPGSLDNWPITQQKELFSLFGNVGDLIGVRLTDSFLMVPLKSVSGIWFPTEIKFESCQLCERETCLGRKAPFSPELVSKYE